MTDEVQRDLGNHEARLDHIEKAVAAMADDVKAMRSKMDTAEGGWRVILFLIGVSAASGGLIGWIVSMLTNRPHGVP